MCFIKSSNAQAPAPEQIEQEPIAELKEANASFSKNSLRQNKEPISQNIKTSPIGLSDEANVQKKTLLGE